MRTIILLILLSLTSCATKKIQLEPIVIHKSPELHNADCYIDNQRYSEANILLLEESKEIFKIKASDGKVLGLPIRQCILTKIQTESTFSEEEPNQHWVKCSLGKMSLVTDSLIYLNDERYFYRLKRKDGQVWLLPREHCAIYKFKSN